jgi:hypothetical protein
MGQINLDIGDRSELRLKALAHQWGVPPGRVIDLLCESIDREAMARLAIQALSGPLVKTEDGVARVPARKGRKTAS